MELSKNFAEIERKFLLKGSIPSGLVASTTQVHRHYLYVDTQVEIRIQRRDENRYELERKVPDTKSPLLRWSMKASIVAGEFERLRECAIGNPITYLKHRTDVPSVTIKEYLDQLAGFIIVEVEFDDLQSAQEYHPLYPWISAEITDRAYSRDSGLIYMSNFNELVVQLSV
jgi:CYTH domain-containing protein